MEFDPLTGVLTFLAGCVLALLFNLPFWIKHTKYMNYLDQWRRDHDAYYARLDQEEADRKNQQREECRVALNEVERKFETYSPYALHHSWTQQAAIWIREAHQLLAQDRVTEVRGKVMGVENALQPAYEAWRARPKTCIHNGPVRIRPHR